MKLMDDNLIRLDVEALTPEEAIRAAGQLLTEAGTADASYAEAMVRSFREQGPYFVLAPGIALPHAKPDAGVREASVSFVRLKQPVPFGHPENDPVDLVFALGSSASEDHIAMLRKLTSFLIDADHIERLRHAKSPAEIRALWEQTNPEKGGSET